MVNGQCSMFNVQCSIVNSHWLENIRLSTLVVKLLDACLGTNQTLLSFVNALSIPPSSRGLHEVLCLVFDHFLQRR